MGALSLVHLCVIPGYNSGHDVYGMSDKLPWPSLSKRTLVQYQADLSPISIHILSAPQNGFMVRTRYHSRSLLDLARRYLQHLHGQEPFRPFRRVLQYSTLLLTARAATATEPFVASANLRHNCGQRTAARDNQPTPRLQQRFLAVA